MRPARLRLLVWAVVFAVAYLAHALLAARLAARDPITEVLLGRAGSLLPVAMIVLLLRFGLIVLLPGFMTVAIARVGLEALASRMPPTAEPVPSKDE